MKRAAKNGKSRESQADKELAEHVAAANGNGATLPPKDHNQLTDDQQRVIFFDHLAKVRKAKDKIASATAELRNLYKFAKADSISKKDIDHALRLETADEADLIEERRRLDQIARWIGSPVGTQAELFDGTDRTPLVDRAKEAGKIVGLKGEVCSVPAQYQGAGEQAWIDGWHLGNDARQETIKARTEAELNSAEGQATLAQLGAIGKGEGAPENTSGTGADPFATQH
ncbi:MAG: hypothetical protein KIS96_11480 [Bauldia sp.]|nr:hypothetical protein [Bauldia sp.]